MARVAAKPVVGDTIRIATARLDSLLLQVEEMLSVKLAIRQQVQELREIVTFMTIWQKEWAKTQPGVKALADVFTHYKYGNGISREAVAQVSDVLAFLDFNKARLEALNDQMNKMLKRVQRSGRQLDGMVETLLDDMKQTLMHPFSLLLDMFPKMVRDLSRSQGKEVDLVTRGADVEIDRRILEELRSPLIHLLRNAVDHGIEDPIQREKHNKPRRGTITIAVAQLDAGKVQIIVSDDGAGIDLDKLKAKAVQQGIIAPAEADALDERDAYALMFHSALSTSPIITEISGRGLGMAIVQEKIQNLGGKIVVTSTPQLGTVFDLTVPVTLATFRGILVQVANRRFIVPTANVKRVARITANQIKTIENKETIVLDDEVLSLVRLEQVLGLPPASRPDAVVQETIPVLLISAANEVMAFAVDQILNEQEVLTKGLGNQLARVRNIAGATILGSGKAVPILHVGDLLTSARNVSNTHIAPTAAETETGPKSILVVDDSITSRTLLQNVLAAVGYMVKTSVDGVDAFTALKTEHFDLLVADVQMPRMDGFELTEKIRADERLSDLPIVLVTSLGAREDRERGIDAGADAYVVKSNFDQTNLLTIVQRLIG